MFNTGMSVDILRDCLVVAAYRGLVLLFTDIRSMFGERLEVLHVL
jgi:hypothetical protein